ncbi:MAG: hypothetical protein ETSY1_32950 [Candidatus Entotheonella factor]|uniref:Helicase XPB/Ssl2 N-terminal domain-containing protein n=1 Tax=Entotheonella factor TaxID=1429438 RepID=W4LAZ6_ENTF1|nr:hypothetical protein [Candidatus Entotheonella palauensis]ETW94880.1 MAG: hypothetical protein ETSY1_32950 [Candidatus Entotheonella factor]
MARKSKPQPETLSLADAFHILTVDDLKARVSLLKTSEEPKRKADFIAVIEKHLEGDRLKALWERLDDLQQKAVSEAIYASDGVFDRARFQAKYGELPDFGTRTGRWSSSVTPSLLRLFIYSEARYHDTASVVPKELRQRLLKFVPQPAAPALDPVDELPEVYELEEVSYSLADDDDGIVVVMGKRAYQMPLKPPSKEVTVEHIPIVRRDMERAASQDLQTVLRLIDRGKVTVSDKTLQPSAATMKGIAEVLRDGDFFEDSEVGPLKAFAWPLLVQVGRLAELQGKKLALTRAGRKALSTPPAETLRSVWQRWLKSTMLDEFNRINEIKGQRGKGKRAMTALAGRRAVIASALEQCPVGSWVSFDTYSRFMQAGNFNFEITRDPWQLYIVDANYGNLGNQGYHDWTILQDRYLLCLLFEYVATLGLIDVAYINPHGARPNFRDLWGADDLDFLSRYDGLLYFRLNPLGAFCLGLASDYVPSELEARGALTVMPNLQIQSTGEALSPDEILLLDTYAEHESEDVWRLSRDKALSAVESGNQIQELQAFLSSRDEQPLPDTVESFISTTERQAKALVNKGMALLIECVDADVAEQVANHEVTKSLCQRAGDRHLVVQAETEASFRKALHTLGYGMPKV